jgi:hypothetical protein
MGWFNNMHLFAPVGNLNQISPVFAASFKAACSHSLIVLMVSTHEAVF